MFSSRPISTHRANSSGGFWREKSSVVCFYVEIQAFQNIALRKLTNALPYVSNYTHRTDLKLRSINEEAYCERFF